MLLTYNNKTLKRSSLLQNNKLLGNTYCHQILSIQPRLALRRAISFNLTNSTPKQSFNLSKQIRSNRQPSKVNLSQKKIFSSKLNKIGITNQSPSKNIKKSKQRNQKSQVKLQNEEVFPNKLSLDKTSSMILGKRRKMLKRKMAFNPALDSFYSPFVDVIIIDKVKRIKDLESQTIKMKFENIYRKLIKHQLTGQFTANFMYVLEKNIREIVKNEELYINPFQIELQSHFKTYSRKQELIDAIYKLQNSLQTFKLYELVKYYCVPSRQICQSILKELIDHLVVQIYQNKNCRRDIDYVLINQEGEIVQHICQIYFSTMQLYITPKQSPSKSYHRFKLLLAEKHRDSRVCLNQLLKENFIDKIVHDKIQNRIINYEINVNQFQKTRIQMFKHAESALCCKSKARIKTKRQKERFDEQASKNIGFSRDREAKSHYSHDLYSNYIRRKRGERRQYIQILEKLHKILDPHNNYNISCRAQENTRIQFRRLYAFNQKYDITFNHLHNDKILVKNMLQNCTLFNTKSQEQLNKIKALLCKVYNNGGQELKELFYWQFKEIFETAHGVSSKETIMKLVLTYFDFNEFGELSKKDFQIAIDICMSLYGRSMQIIKYIVWNYLQSAKIVEGGVIPKKNLQMDFEACKIVFILLVSIIFGTEYCSVEEMLNAILENQNY